MEIAAFTRRTYIFILLTANKGLCARSHWHRGGGRTDKHPPAPTPHPPPKTQNNRKKGKKSKKAKREGRRRLLGGESAASAASLICGPVGMGPAWPGPASAAPSETSIYQMKGKAGACGAGGWQAKQRWGGGATRILPVGEAPHVSSETSPHLLGLCPASRGMLAHTFRGRSHPPPFYSSEERGY